MARPVPGRGEIGVRGPPPTPSWERRCTVQGDTASFGTPNTPHPSRDSRTAHEPRHPVQAGGGFAPVGQTGFHAPVLRGAMAGATPSEDGETSPFTARRMSLSRLTNLRRHSMADARGGRTAFERLLYGPRSRLVCTVSSRPSPRRS